MHLRTYVLRTGLSVLFATSLAACAGVPASGPPIVSQAPAASTDRMPALSLAAFDGAIPPYLRERERAGLSKPGRAVKSWLDRDAYEKTRSVAALNSYHYLLFGSNAVTNTVDIYQDNTYEPQNPNQPIIGQISLAAYAAGMTVDRSQNLYVIDYGKAIREYSPYSMPHQIKTFDDPYFPQGLAVGPDGTLYAANTSADPNGNVGISVFPPGSTTPAKLLTDPSFHYALYPTVDSQGNVYVVYSDKAHTNLGSFGVFKAGSSKLTPIPLTSNLYQAELDAAGDILAADPNTASIDTIRNGTLSPASSLVTESMSDFFLFDQTYARNQVFTEPFDSAHGLGGGPLLQFTYPQGLQLDTIKHGYNYEFGIVTSPAAPLAPPYVLPSSGGSSTPPPASPTPTQGPCSNGSTGPLPDSVNDQITYGGGTNCVGPMANSEQLSTTATLFNATDNEAVQSFSFGATGASDAKKITTVCPGFGSYYVIVTSNVAPPVKSATVTKAGC